MNVEFLFMPGDKNDLWSCGGNLSGMVYLNLRLSFETKT